MFGFKIDFSGALEQAIWLPEIVANLREFNRA
jgi:hypothetical protein